METLEILDKFIDRVPWIAALVLILWAGNKFVLPFYQTFLSSKKTSMKSMQEKLLELEKKLETIGKELEDTKTKYSELKGTIIGVNIHLRTHGFPEIPIPEDLIKTEDG